MNKSEQEEPEKQEEQEPVQEEKEPIKVAVSATGQDIESEINARFGRCPYFLIIEIEDKEIKEVKAIENTAAAQAGGAGITAAQIVADQEVEAVITTNIGPRAFDVFSQLGIKIYQAEQGKVKDVIAQFIEGELKEVSVPTGPQHMGISRFAPGMGSGRGRAQGGGMGRRFQQ